MPDRIFALPPGVDFPRALVAGLIRRMADQPPEAMAAVTLYLNTNRMRARVSQLFARQAMILPRLRVLTDISPDRPFPDIPKAVPPLRRRLELAQLVDRLLQAQPDLAPRAALYDLSDSLATLMEEMQIEGVPPDRISALDVSDHSAHWARTQNFLRIVNGFFDGSAQPDGGARQRMIVDRLIALWQVAPPPGPVIVAGSTGSRGTVFRFMQAVAGLPQGMLVFPGFDFDMPSPVWDRLDDVLTAEDHPQYRFRRLLSALNAGPQDVQRWTADAPASPARNRLISLSLRPAPVTDQWLTEGQHLPDLLAATDGMTLIEAQTPRAEALSIALILRQAAEDGRSATLVTPDRNLGRLVTAALDRWGIAPDDSAGNPLALSPPGRFLRHVAALQGRRLTSDALLVILKHPFTFTGGDRGMHLKLTRSLELRLRAKGPAFPTAHTLRDFATKQRDPGASDWAAALIAALDGLEETAPLPLAAHITRHRARAEALSRGTATGTGEIWERDAGAEALKLMDDLASEAEHGGVLTVADYRDLFDALVNQGEVRSDALPHPHIRIWGPREAREAGTELVILGGLNDGSWPRLPDPDPWLNRQMRKQAGLLLPERQIGLSAHDYQQAIAAPEVILTHATRDAEAETVPSRWLNRLTNLMAGLPDRNGPDALKAMQARGRRWLDLAAALDMPPAEMTHDPRLQLAKRPSPRPPVTHRPKLLPVTRIARLIRDPYAVYARSILDLKPLDPLRAKPDARLRGQILHLILERFVRERPEAEDRAAARLRLLDTARQVLAQEVPWPAARLLWLARLDRAADFFLSTDAESGKPILLEEMSHKLRLDPFDFELEGKPDRIDRLADGSLAVIDYKTGEPPTAAMQANFDKQLLLIAAMIHHGAFPALTGSEVARITYVGLGSNPKKVETEITDEVIGKVWEGLHRLIGSYAKRGKGYTARRALFSTREGGDYDHLSRFGEWDLTDAPLPEDVGTEGDAT
ncbi:MAG: double-strand break repair protein AddB [Rhodobacteraceae bacterium PARR1]|nr:MAG: double-strand break repair protein AddB [Rhodobacteraceae bacterium PARR1]